MSRGFLPRQDVQFTSAAGRPTTAFYTWLQGLEAALQGGTTVEQLQADLARLRAEVAAISTSGFLPVTTAVGGRNSVRVTGTLSGGIVLVQLQGDVGSPGPTRYYGTDAAGDRGYHDHALATLSDVDVVTVPPFEGDSLVHDGTEWVPRALALDDLADVDAPSPSVGDALIFNGTDWEPGQVSAAGGLLPLTTGEIAGDQPVFVYGPDGRLIYAPVN